MKPNGSEIICPDCGAANLAGSIHCAECGRRLATHGQASQVWSRPNTGQTGDGTGVIDLVPAAHLSSQATTPIPNGDWATGATTPLAPGANPAHSWPGSTPPPTPSIPPARPKPGGPPGCVLGCLGLLIVLGVAGLFVWSVGRPYVRDRVGDKIVSGISTQVSDIPRVTVTTAGRLVLTDAEINSAINGYSGSIDPISEPVAAIDRNGVHVTFKVYGTSSEFSGLPVVQGGRIVIRDAKITGVAGQFVDASTIATIVETQLAGLMTRSNLTPVSLVLGQGALSVVTSQATGTTV